MKQFSRCPKEGKQQGSAGCQISSPDLLSRRKVPSGASNPRAAAQGQVHPAGSHLSAELIVPAPAPH